MQIDTDVVFGTGGGRELKLDLYWPDDVSATRTAVLLIHGGGWRVGSRAGVAAYGEALARLGFLAAAIEYRLLDEAPWPAQLDDVKTAVAYVRDSADSLGVDPARIVLQGFSAGGHLALLAGDDLKAGAVVALFPPVDLVIGTPDIGQAPAVNLLAGAVEESAARLASPLHRAGPGFPPTFLIHGAEDWLVNHASSQRMFDALIAAGVKAELHIYSAHTHEFADAPYMLEPVEAEAALFIRRHLIDPEWARRQDLKHNVFAHGPEEFRRRMAARNAQAEAS